MVDGAEVIKNDVQVMSLLRRRRRKRRRRKMEEEDFVGSDTATSSTIWMEQTTSSWTWSRLRLNLYPYLSHSRSLVDLLSSGPCRCLGREHYLDEGGKLALVAAPLSCFSCSSYRFPSYRFPRRFFSSSLSFIFSPPLPHSSSSARRVLTSRSSNDGAGSDRDGGATSLQQSSALTLFPGAWSEGKHCTRRGQASDTRDWSRHQGSALHQGEEGEGGDGKRSRAEEEVVGG
eukprot:766683-Hanusia_phi.AAC.8